MDRIAARGAALLEAGCAQDAVALLTNAHQRHPTDVRILKLNSQALIGLGRAELAIGGLLLAADLQPDDAGIHFALGILLSSCGSPDQAMAYSLQAFRLAPTAVNATALSAVLIALGRYQDALAAAEHALALRPGHWEALANRVVALQGLGRFGDAVPAGRQAVGASPPGNAQTRYNLGCALLGLGQFTAEAWELFEWRLRLDGNPGRLLATAGKRWNGEDIAGRTILLQAEQGFGDTLQFVRYAPLVAKRAGRVILEVQPALARLLHRVPGVDQVVATGDALPHFDLVCPLLSLPRIFGTTLDTIPPALPYADAGRPHGASATALRVGLAWAGSRTNKDDRQRSLAATDLAALAGIPGVQCYSLQQHEPGRAELPPGLGVVDLMGEVRDFADTAALVASLDLVVSVDTAVAHLAATMNKPVWLLSRWRGCWRWQHDRANSPWYPSLRVFRQGEPNNWAGALQQVRQELAALALVSAARP